MSIKIILFASVSRVCCCMKILKGFYRFYSSQVLINTITRDSFMKTGKKVNEMKNSQEAWNWSEWDLTRDFYCENIIFTVFYLTETENNKWQPWFWRVSSLPHNSCSSWLFLKIFVSTSFSKTCSSACRVKVVLITVIAFTVFPFHVSSHFMLLALVPDDALHLERAQSVFDVN